MSERDAAAKADAIREALAERESVLIALSGGVDSSVVAVLAHEAFGDDAIICTAKNETLSDAELDSAKRVVEEIGIEHLTVEFSELDNPDFAANDDDRCYHCRTMRLGRMYEAACDRGIEAACDGTNASDPGEGHRPDLRAVEELEVLLSFLVHGITKKEVRAIADDYDLPVADRPSMACLSSRIPTGLEVTEERFSRVERAETILRTRGFEQFRARDHDGLARIEVAPEEFDRALDADFVHAVRDHLEDASFNHVTLDLHGCRTGSVSPGAEAETGADAGDDDPPVDDMFTQDYPMWKWLKNNSQKLKPDRQTDLLCQKLRLVLSDDTDERFVAAVAQFDFELADAVVVERLRQYHLDDVEAPHLTE